MSYQINELNSYMKETLGRSPSALEKRILTALWSEHCSYRSTKDFLKNLYSMNDEIFFTEQEGGGVLKLPNGKFIVFKIESHNHPSFIDPYNGAATGVGGVLRDIFTMGAKPIGVLDGLFFGDLTHPRTKDFVRQIVRGVSTYGNCFGAPNVGGITIFDSAYDNNILVNAMAVGLINDRPKLLSKVNKKFDDGVVIYVGRPTSIEGVDGAVMSSKATTSKEASTPNPYPFFGHMLCKFCLHLHDNDVNVAIQDLGAAGISCALFEMCNKNDIGARVMLDSIPVVDDLGYEYNIEDLFISESQERLLLFAEAKDINAIKSKAEDFLLDFAVLGYLNDSKSISIYGQGAERANLPFNMIDKYPKRQHDIEAYKKNRVLEKHTTPSDNLGISDRVCLDRFFENGYLRAKNNIYEQYDATIMAKTIHTPSFASSVVMLSHNEKEAIAINLTATSNYSKYNPYLGAIYAVVGGYAKAISVGCKPKAITNNLNAGDPNNLQTMSNIYNAFEGMNAACKKLDLPIVSGNVSLNNSYNGTCIPLTLTIGTVGFTEDVTHLQHDTLEPGDEIFVVGQLEKNPEFTIYEKIKYGSMSCSEEKLNFDFDKLIFNSQTAFDLIDNKMVKLCIPILSGGVFCALFRAICKDLKFNELGIELFMSIASSLIDDWYSYIVVCEKGKFGNKNDNNCVKIGNVVNDNTLYLSDDKIDVKHLKDMYSLLIPDL